MTGDEVESLKDRTKLGIEIAEAVRRFCSTFEGAEPAALEHPASDGGWSVRDILAHVVHWHERCLTAIRTTLDGTYERSSAINEDEENAKAVADHASTPTAQLMDRVKVTGLEVSAAVSQIPEEIWQEKRHLQGWILGTTLNHYKDHEHEVAKALDGSA